ncbi:sugar ABC transporter substrate-binding protein [Georgenia satyanarayanai]|uniref:ABC transporter substrate-binding protein n=1 Tax=Georgenia satyanarayanai TaxID=860221 RepID=UPI00203E6B4C|nr:sugar ABC transporter substrate-binding protein [Georgenia satyanarayanai]MCM3661399.1 sugar ABC transporter substrate-binding protein [Georgenia satyanarayanai]
MKRRASLPTAAVLVIGLAIAGCASERDTNPTATADVDPAVAEWAETVKEQHEGETVTIAAQTHPSTEAMQTMTPQFEELTGIDVVWDVVDQNSLKQKIELDFQSNNQAYDVAMIDSFWISGFTEKGVIADISDRVTDAEQTPEFFDYEDILPAYREGLDKYDGVTYGVQIAGESRFLAYRTDLFEEHGKEPPTTTDELLELAAYFDENSDVSGIAMRAQKGIHFTSGLMTLMYQFSDGFFDPETNESMVTSEDNVQALEYYLALLEYAPSDVASYTHEEALSAFMGGHAAMWFDATAIAPSIIDPDQSVVVDDVAFVGPPEGENGTYGALAGWSLGIAGNSENADAAWAFITYMTSGAMAPTYVELGGVPTRTSVLENPTTPEQELYYGAMLEALDAAGALVDRGISWLPQVPLSDEKLTVIGNYGSEALAGSLTAEEALQRADREIAALG